MFDRLASERDGSGFITALRRQWWVIVLVAAIAAAGAYVLSKRQEKKYTATSGLLFVTSHLDQELVGKQIVDNTDPNRQAATNQSLLEVSTVARMVAHQLGISPGQVSSEVSFGSDSNSDVVKISVTDPNPLMAARIANSYVNQYIVFRKSADIAVINATEAPVVQKLAAIPLSQQNGPVAQALITERNELDLLKSAQTGNAQVVQTATVPGSPSFPHPTRDGVLGLMLGLLVGFGLVAALSRRDRRIRSLEEVEEIYGVPVLGTIPESTSLRDGRPATAQEEEAFLMVRTQLRYFDVDRTISRLMVTSADSGEGKTLLSLNLARAAARTDGKRALLIECDMRRPTLGRLIGRSGEAGLAELLSNPHDLPSGLRELVIQPGDIDDARSALLDVLLAGAMPPNPIELLESNRMSELLEVAEDMYDIVVIDTPPVGIVSDAIPLIHQVDGLVVISRIGMSRRDHAMRLMKRLRGLNAQIFGVVVNSYRPSVYGSGYGYAPVPTDGNGAARRSMPRRRSTPVR